MHSDREYIEQDLNLRRDLNALRARGRREWRRERLLEWVCEGCGASVLEVMQTTTFRVIYKRTTIEGRKSGRNTVTPLAAHRPSDAGAHQMHAVCYCQNRPFSLADVWDDLDHGKKKRTLPPFRDPNTAVRPS